MTERLRLSGATAFESDWRAPARRPPRSPRL